LKKACLIARKILFSQSRVRIGDFNARADFCFIQCEIFFKWKSIFDMKLVECPSEEDIEIRDFLFTQLFESNEPEH
jgi:hypothetical protein